jgi:shikimate dehydrogenase
MYPNIGETAIRIDEFPDLEAVVDVVYNPLSSALVVEAKKRKIKAVGGLFMLVAQAFFACELFLDKKLSQTQMSEIYNKILDKKQNVVLIGMPGCGKTTIGKALAENLGKCFIDTDEEIVKQEGISIPEIFKTCGEKTFREIENKVISEISANQGLVIATGGGAVLNSRNIDLLKENGKVVFLDKDIDDIVTTSDRPLSSNKQDLQKRYDERYDIYVSSADFKIDCNNNVVDNVNAIKEVIFSENFSD